MTRRMCTSRRGTIRRLHSPVSEHGRAQITRFSHLSLVQINMTEVSPSNPTCEQCQKNRAPASLHKMPVVGIPFNKSTDANNPSEPWTVEPSMYCTVTAFICHYLPLLRLGLSVCLSLLQLGLFVCLCCSSVCLPVVCLSLLQLGLPVCLSLMQLGLSLMQLGQSVSAATRPVCLCRSSACLSVQCCSADRPAQSARLPGSLSSWPGPPGRTIDPYLATRQRGRAGRLVADAPGRRGPPDPAG